MFLVGTRTEAIADPPQPEPRGGKAGDPWYQQEEPDERIGLAWRTEQAEHARHQNEDDRRQHCRQEQCDRSTAGDPIGRAAAEETGDPSTPWSSRLNATQER